jgi:RimJ/RimL family protein N-acetyltransferase
MKFSGTVHLRAADESAASLLTEKVTSGEWSVPVMPDEMAGNWPAYQALDDYARGADGYDYFIIGHFGTPIGFARISVDLQTNDAEIDFLAGREDIWERGAGTDTLLRLAAECVGPLGASHVWVQLAETNTGMTSIARKMGFLQEAMLRTPGRRNGARHAVVIFGMLASRFHRIYGPVISGAYSDGGPGTLSDEYKEAKLL